MADTSNPIEDKVQAIFTEIAGADRAKWLRGGVPSRVMNQIGSAMNEDYEPKVAGELGFHLGDWKSDAAFLVALHLFPERFTPEEINDKVHSLLVHVPAHVMAATRLSGYPAKDIFR